MKTFERYLGTITPIIALVGYLIYMWGYANALNDEWECSVRYQKDLYHELEIYRNRVMVMSRKELLDEMCAMSRRKN